MKALVTGGAGFIGSHLAQALSDLGIEVRILDNFILGSRQNLEASPVTNRFDIRTGDIRDVSLVREMVEGCQWVFHLAALPSVPRSIEHPIESNSHNLDGTLQLLEAARDAGVERFLFASSSAIYGESPVAIKREDLPPAPLSPYALQKYAAERYAQLFHHLYGLNTVCLRYFNVFGPRQSHDSPYSGVVARFCQAFLGDRSPTIFGDGLQSRDFTYIDNVVEANLLAVQAPVEAVAGRVFNVAGGTSISLLDIIRVLNRLTGRNLHPIFMPERVGDIRHSHADIGAAQAAFGYRPRIDWGEGLERTLAWYRDRQPSRSSSATHRLSWEPNLCPE